MITLIGNPANSGYIKSKAFVVTNNSFDESLMETGNILVIKFFLPQYFSLIIKASAVVTEFGGITCHAASLSRELNVPCIVSVEHVTEQIQTNDIVEIDGDKGIVNIWKN